MKYEMKWNAVYGFYTVTQGNLLGTFEVLGSTGSQNVTKTTNRLRGIKRKRQAQKFLSCRDESHQIMFIHFFAFSKSSLGIMHISLESDLHQGKKGAEQHVRKDIKM